MKTLRTILVACAFGVGLAACGDATSLVAPEAPRSDGGVFTGGSGGRAGDSMHTDTTAATPAAGVTAEGTSAERGTYTVGSGG